jgi:ATP-dependent Clp protease ATP-binding subunit ClpA
LDAWIPFRHLEESSIERVVDKMVAELEEQLTDKRITLTLSPEARTWLGKKGYSRKFGARPMERLIDQEIRRKLADDILFGDLKDGGDAHVDWDKDKDVLTIHSKSRIEPVQSKKKAAKKSEKKESVN